MKIPSHSLYNTLAALPVLVGCETSGVVSIWADLTNSWNEWTPVTRTYRLPQALFPPLFSIDTDIILWFYHEWAFMKMPKVKLFHLPASAENQNSSAQFFWQKQCSVLRCSNRLFILLHPMPILDCSTIISKVLCPFCQISTCPFSIGQTMQNIGLRVQA